MRGQGKKGGRGGNILDESIVTPSRPQSIFQERWTWAGSKGTVAKVLSLAFTMKRRKDYSILFHVVLFVFASFPSSFPPCTSRRHLVPRAAADCLTCPTSKFTLYRRSTKPPGPFRALLKIEDAICLAARRAVPANVL